MYSKEQAAQLREEFWTALGKYLSPIKSAEGLKISWLNYKTGNKFISFKLQADKNFARVAIEITHPDNGIQELIFDQFLQFKNILDQYLNEEWKWDLLTYAENNKTLSRIFFELNEVSIYKRDDWPKLISFFKPRIILLDEFWTDVKEQFEIFR